LLDRIARSQDNPRISTETHRIKPTRDRYANPPCRRMRKTARRFVERTLFAQRRKHRASGNRSSVSFKNFPPSSVNRFSCSPRKRDTSNLMRPVSRRAAPLKSPTADSIIADGQRESSSCSHAPYINRAIMQALMQYMVQSIHGIVHNALRVYPYTRLATVPPILPSSHPPSLSLSLSLSLPLPLPLSLSLSISFRHVWTNLPKEISILTRRQLPD